MKRTMCFLAAVLASAVVSAQLKSDPPTSLRKKMLALQAQKAGIAFGKVAGTNTVCVLDSIYQRSWNSFNNSWNDFSRTTYQYDTKSNRYREIYSYQTGASWYVNSRRTRTYDAANNLTNDLQETAASPNVWTPSIRYVYAYNSQNDQLSESDEVWNTQTNAWQLNALISMAYDQNGYLASSVSSMWNNQQNMLVYDSRQSYTNTSGGLVSVELDENWNTVTNSWDKQTKIMYDYDIFGNLLTGTLQAWSGSAWEMDERATWTYNGNSQLLTIVDEMWNSQANTWVNNVKETNTYDAAGNLTQQLDQNWNTQTNSWDNASRMVFTYNNNNKVLSAGNDDWVAGAWKQSFSIIYQYDTHNNETYNKFTFCAAPAYTCQPSNETYSYYNCTTVGLTENATEASFLVYPTLVSDILRILSGTPLPFTITDVKGITVLTSSGDDCINVSALSPGIYFIYSDDRRFPGVQKFIKE